MNIFFADSAVDDLEQIKRYYEKEQIAAIGYQFVDSIINHIQTLAENPDIGRVVPEFEEVTLRELIHPPFRIVYLREKSAIQVIRVWRSERLLILPEERE